jgi:hypothetical protein
MIDAYALDADGRRTIKRDAEPTKDKPVHSASPTPEPASNGTLGQAEEARYIRTEKATERGTTTITTRVDAPAPDPSRVRTSPLTGQRPLG